MAKFHGVGVSFGVSSSFSGLTAAQGSFQTLDHGLNASNEKVANGSGEFTEISIYGFNDTAVFEYVATAASVGGQAPVTMPIVGDIITVTDNQYTQISQTNWVVESVSVKGSNTTAKRVTVNLWRAPLILT